jgi:hypothetical protein
MRVGGLVDTVFRFNRLCECHLYTAPRNMKIVNHYWSLEMYCTRISDKALQLCHFDTHLIHCYNRFAQPDGSCV